MGSGRISIDISDYLDEFDAEILIAELKRRANREKKDIFQDIIKNDPTSENIFLPQNLRDLTLSKITQIALMVGLNYLASKEDVIEEIKKL